MPHRNVTGSTSPSEFGQRRELTWQDVDQSVLEFVDWQTGTDEFHWIYLHTGQPLKHYQHHLYSSQMSLSMYTA